ncbi:hypothetical protein KCP70_20815 [Salmonella enterica subsp. enterica]|nr:hypothetical protein KCP70_20815 [Salmonella enterica subsp. enterica]
MTMTFFFGEERGERTKSGKSPGSADATGPMRRERLLLCENKDRPAGWQEQVVRRNLRAISRLAQRQRCYFTV